MIYNIILINKIIIAEGNSSRHFDKKKEVYPYVCNEFKLLLPYHIYNNLKSFGLESVIK